MEKNEHIHGCETHIKNQKYKKFKLPLALFYYSILHKNCYPKYYLLIQLILIQVLKLSQALKSRLSCHSAKYNYYYKIIGLNYC